MRSGTPENQEAFTKALGFELDLSFYENLADLTGLVFQGDVDFSGLAREDINVDLSVDDIMSIFHDRDYTFASPRIADEFSEMFDQIESTIGRLTPRQRRSAQYAYQAFFTLMFHMTNSGDLSLPTEELPIFHVILDDRNAHIARAVHESEHDKIDLLYGALHYGGIVEELKRLDTTW